MQHQVTSIKIAIADDHPIVLSGVSELLNKFTHFDVVATYNSGAALLEGIAKGRPDVLLLDVHLPDAKGPDLVKVIHKKYPNLKILAFTSDDSFFEVKTMMKNGCSGYLIKSAQLPALKEAIETIFNGGEYLELSLKEELVQSLWNDKKALSEHQNIQLTKREKELLKLISEGHTNTEIAGKLFLSHRTIENNRLSLYQKLEVKNTAELIRRALEWRLIE